MLEKRRKLGLVAVNEGTRYTVLVHLAVKKGNIFLNILNYKRNPPVSLNGLGSLQIWLRFNIWSYIGHDKQLN